MRPGILGLMFLLLSLYGCVGPMVSVRSADRAPPEDRVIRTHIEFVDSEYRTIPKVIVKQPSQRGFEEFHKVLWLSLYPVPGRIAGIPRPRFFEQILKSEEATGAWMESGTQENFALSLAELEHMLAKYASGYVPRPEDHNFTVEPADTRFVRLTLTASGSSFSYMDQHESGFVEHATRDHYVLVYVDRPCQISGDIQPNDGLYRHRLTFDRPGLHWLHINKMGERTATVTVGDPVGPVAVYVRYDRVAPH
ncbi:hypothetical protein [Thiobacillus sp.]|uniref:hypothetical protein n=1 Tax=Thiobacillus sp. TaxID=924 RepID=UPI0011D73E52|nr:hypothetical protein [Thiobacillus sp.]TXH74919.1 MAG: hypothetical protein E6Q82_07980 [Thiobacillus sp.]